MNNIIFLDIDGVLSYYTKRSCEKFMICQDRMMLVADLARRTHSQIVISSTWRLGTPIHYFQEIFWHFTCLTSHYFDWIVESEVSEYIFVIDKTPKFWGCKRGMEIQYWLDAHAGMISNYVIIDDDTDFLPSQMQNFVKTDGIKGITMKEIKLCEEILLK